MPEPRVQSEANEPSALRAISESYWPEHARLSPDRYARALTRLRLAHLASPRIQEQVCPRCGGDSFGVYSARLGSLQCVRCRQIICPRAGPVAEFAALAARLGDPGSRGVKVGPRRVRCTADCVWVASDYCSYPDELRLDAQACCLSVESRECPAGQAGKEE